MKQIVLHDRGIVPILINFKCIYVVKVIFDYTSNNGYYILRNLPNITGKNWMFIEHRFAQRLGEELFRAKSIQEACQEIMDFKSSSYTMSLWEFDSEEEFRYMVKLGDF